MVMMMRFQGERTSNHIMKEIRRKLEGDSNIAEQTTLYCNKYYSTETRFVLQQILAG